MSLAIRLLSFTSLAALAAAGSALASQPPLQLTASDPFFSETPLTKEELQEARGGFRQGGFEFNFAVVIQPLELFPNGVLNNGGNDSQGSNSKGGMFGEDGVFGPGGVFGDSQAPDTTGGANTDATAAGATVLVPVIVPATNTTAPSQAQPAPNQTVVASAAPTTDAAQPASVETAAQAADSGHPSAPPASSDAPAPEGAAPQTLASANDGSASIATAQSSPQNPAADEGAKNAEQAPAAVQTDAPPLAIAENPAAKSAGPVQMQGYSIDANGATLVFNNTMDNVVIRQQVDFNVAVPNFSQAVAMIAASSAASQAIATQFILNPLQ